MSRAGLDDVLTALEALAAEAFDLADRVEASICDGLDGALPSSRTSLRGVEQVALDGLTAAGSHLQGAGFVADIGLLREDRWWLEWFVRESDGRTSRLEVQTDPDAMGFHDYEPLQWFAVPKQTGARYVTGPYVDNLCTEDYTLTFTQPMLLDGTFVGVTGADIGVRAAERELLPVLRRVPAPVAIVNDDGRTLVSNTGSLVCGELLGTPVDRLESRSLPGLPLHVVALSS